MKHDAQGDKLTLSQCLVNYVQLNSQVDIDMQISPSYTI